MMDIETGMSQAQVINTEWYKAIAKYQRPSLSKAIWQLINTFVPYVVVWVLAVGALQHGYPRWVVLLLIAVGGLLLVRIFIFFHDCTHISFFASRRANCILGYITGILTFTPHEEWQHSHLLHHATVADLDRRGEGDMWTLTVAEYRAAPLPMQIAYRLVRNPVVYLGLVPLAVFVVAQRFPRKKAGQRERFSVIFTDVALLAILIVKGLTIGLPTYLVLQIPMMALAGAIGYWLFYVQHQFEGVYWTRHKDWDPIRAALAGASYYRLPGVLQWITGNIGFHHLHHLRPRIPNYNLPRCFAETPAVQSVRPLTLWASFRCMRLKLWDEARQELVSFSDLRSIAW